ncbi:SRPBCC family protein [Actinomadura sp. 3N407]|uniref:SRPBCC family protein n=1 Tax=Actinomadura sp. 3N407 TaxID=3457423 RepID=UPI003FCD208F
MTKDATLQTFNGEPTLRFERRLAHPPAKVWRAVSDPAEMAHWFPARVEAELRPGAPMRFIFPEEPTVDGASDGEVLEVDPPRVFTFRWNADVLRFELIPDGDGCLLVFTQTIGGGRVGLLGAGRTAAGWDTCLDELAGRLDGAPVPARTDWLGPMEHYIDKFGLGEGTVGDTGDGHELHFARDLVWKPVGEVWRLLIEDTTPSIGDEPPTRATNGYVQAGKVTAVDPPRLLEYEWLHDGMPAGNVRWEIFSDPQLGVRVELTQTLPRQLAHLLSTSLAAWHVQLELFFAATHGDIRCPWPKDRTDQLTKHYATQLT